MKTFPLILFTGFIVAGISGSKEKQTTSSSTQKVIVKDTSSFTDNIQPILQKNCSPCHFPGGKMYAKLPFDSPLTIVALKKERVLMRIKDETQKEIIRKYIEQNQ